MEVSSVRIKEAILHANVESITKQNGSISNPSFIPSTNDIFSVHIQVSEVMDDVVKPFTSHAIYITPPDDAYVVPTTNPILDELLKEFGDELLDTTMLNDGEDCNPIKDIEEHERILAKDPQSSFMKIKALSCIVKTNEDFDPFNHIQQSSPLYGVFKSSKSSTKPCKVKFDGNYPQWFLKEDAIHGLG
ncbi:hypothetical protein Tco_0982851 [Tanacetum coccineum]